MIYLYMQRFHLFLLVVTMTYSGRALATRAPCPEGSLHGTGRRGSTRICIDFPWGFHRQGYFFFFFLASLRVEQDLTENGMSEELLPCTWANQIS